jgi:O-antigen ligase
MGLLPVLLGFVLAIAAIAVALARPNLLIYAYSAAIPFNFALPPGPGGTVARVAGIVFFVGYIIRKPDSFRAGTIPLVGWVFVAWTLASCVWALDSNTAFQTWLSLAQLFAITVLIASLVAANPEIARGALWSYSISAACTSVVAILWYFQGGGIFSRATAFTDQDPALFASLVLAAAVFLVGEVGSPGTATIQRAVATAALLFCIIALALSGTRSAWIGFAASIVLWLVVQRDPRQAIVIAALGCGVAILLASDPGAGDFLSGRIASSLATGGAGRTDIWLVGLNILASAPLIGVGFANFGVAFTPYAISQTSGASAAAGALVAGRAPHNVLLGISVETGVLGAALLVSLFALALAPTSRGRTCTIARVALAGLIVQSMFLDILLQKQLWLFLAIALGLATANGHPRDDGDARVASIVRGKVTGTRVTTNGPER